MGLTKNVDFETAKLLKEKGFDLPTQKYYEYALKSKKDKQDGYLGSFGWKKGELYLQSGYFQNNNKSDFTSEMWYMCSAPPIAEVVCWSFNTHKIWITVDININGKFNYLLTQFNPKDRAWEVKNSSSIQEYFNNPDDAYSSGITYFLNNLEMSI